MSHGHNDHTGGLADALAQMNRPNAYLHPAALEPKFSRHRDQSMWDIGMPARCREVLRQQANPIPRLTDFEDPGGAFFRDQAGELHDNLLDDQATFVDIAAGTVVILGCAHAGIVNTLRHIQTLTSQRPIYTAIGSMHLINASPARLAGTTHALRSMGVQQLLPGHCTGFLAMARLWDEFFGRCSPCPAGTILELPR